MLVASVGTAPVKYVVSCHACRRSTHPFDSQEEAVDTWDKGLSLIPCPRCGYVPRIGKGPGGTVVIRCPKCPDHSVVGDTWNQAKLYWNIGKHIPYREWIQ